MTLLRFFTVYGPRGRPDMSIRKFATHISRGETVPLYGDGSFERDFTFVSDIVDGIVAAYELNSDFEIFNLGDSRPVTIRYMLDLIEQNLGRKADIRQFPVAPGDVSRTYADIDKSTRLLGYKPKVSLEEGIRRFVEWFKAHGA